MIGITGEPLSLSRERLRVYGGTGDFANRYLNEDTGDIECHFMVEFELE